MKKILFILLAIFFIGCINNNMEKIEKLQIEKQIHSLNDSIFLSENVPCINTNGTFLLISDYMAGRAYLLNKDYSLHKIIGINGRGPGEFIGAAWSYFLENQICIVDHGNKRFNLYDFEGNYYKDIKVPPGSFLGTKFIIVNDFLYASTPMNDSMFVRINIKTEEPIFFGKFVSNQSRKERLSQNFYHLLFNEKDSTVICIKKTSPVIEIFDLKNNFIKKIILPDNKYFSSRIKFAESEIRSNPQKKESAYTLIYDAILRDNKLYLLIIDNIEKNISSNKIFIYKFEKNNLTFEKILLLTNFEKRVFYSCFSLNGDNQLIAYNDITGSLDVFKLN